MSPIRGRSRMRTLDLAPEQGPAGDRAAFAISDPGLVKSILARCAEDPCSMDPLRENADPLRGPAGTGPPPVRIVIVNYRCAEYTIACLRSIAGEVARVPRLTATVVDNASGDMSAERISGAIQERGWSAWAEVLRLAENGGFASGNNAAIRRAIDSDDPPAYVLLLNPDTELRPGAVATLVEFMERRPEVGIAGCRLEYADGSHQPSAFRFPTILGEIERGLGLTVASRLLRRFMTAEPKTEEGPVEWVTGAVMMVRREVFESVGVLDEGYFLYFEEVDLALNARRAGWPSWYVPSARVMHVMGKSTGLTDKARVEKGRVPAYWFRSRNRYYRKNHGASVALAANAAWCLSYALGRTRRALFRRPDPSPDHLLRDSIVHGLLASLRAKG